MATDFEQNRGKAIERSRFLRNPQGIFHTAYIRHHQRLRRYAEPMQKPRRIGPPCFGNDIALDNPQDRRALQGLESQHGKAKRETGNTACVPCLPPMDLCQRGFGQPSPQCLVQIWRANGKKRRRHGPAASTQQNRLIAMRVCRQFQCFGKRSFYPCDLATQGKYGFPRHGGGHHDAASCHLFMLCSYRFPRSRKESSGVREEFIPLLGFLKRNLTRGFYDRRGSGLESWVTKGYMATKGQSMARIYQTRDWSDQLSPSMQEFELMALETYAHLPAEFRQLTGEIVIQVAEFPTEEIMDDLALETPFDLLGLFEGRGIADRWNPSTGEGPNRVTLYRRAILDYWSENEETLGDIVTHVLIHEIGHHFGLSDDDMERIEEHADQE
jgi:predicted Zn-dependent protease with MMP-like domain